MQKKKIKQEGKLVHESVGKCFVAESAAPECMLISIEILRLKDWGRYVTLIVTTHCNEFVTKTQKNLSYVTTIFWALQNG